MVPIKVELKGVQNDTLEKIKKEEEEEKEKEEEKEETSNDLLLSLINK